MNKTTRQAVVTTVTVSGAVLLASAFIEFLPQGISNSVKLVVGISLIAVAAYIGTTR